MRYDPLNRHSIRLKDHDYSSHGKYFVTICAHDRECVFGEIIDNEMSLNEIGKIVYEEWLKTPTIRKETELDRFIVMPNHLHGIIMINDKTVGATRRVAPNRNETIAYRTIGIIGRHHRSIQIDHDQMQKHDSWNIRYILVAKRFLRPHHPQPG